MEWTGSIRQVVDDIRVIFEGDASGHDLDHTLWVTGLAKQIAEQEMKDSGKQLDLDVVMLAALLHDVDDPKLTGRLDGKLERAEKILGRYQVPFKQQAEILQVIREVSFKGVDSVTPSTWEGRAVQDADRLDAIGAIGIARTFAFGGSRGRRMYDPEEKPFMDMDEQQMRKNTHCTLNHFYEKLFLLKDMMTTVTGHTIAEERHRRMEQFVHDFLQEWDESMGQIAQWTGDERVS